MKHTKGTWLVRKHVKSLCIGPIGTTTVATISDKLDNPNALHDAKRIVDCVNALDGIKNPVATIERIKGILLNAYISDPDLRKDTNEILTMLGV